MTPAEVKKQCAYAGTCANCVCESECPVHQEGFDGEEFFGEDYKYSPKGRIIKSRPVSGAAYIALK